MDLFATNGAQSAEGSQGPAGSLALSPILARCTFDFPAIAAAERNLTRAILDEPNDLSAAELELFLNAAAQRWGLSIGRLALGEINEILVTEDAPPGRFGLKLARFGPWFTKKDCDALVASGWPERKIIGAISVVALGHLRCTLAAGLFEHANSDAATHLLPKMDLDDLPEWEESSQPHLPLMTESSESLQRPFARLRAIFGFVPGIISSLSTRENLASAAVDMIEAVLGPEDHLTQSQKHELLLTLAASNCSSYLVGLHGEILSLLGSEPQDHLQILDDIEHAPIAVSDRLLCTELRKLNLMPARKIGLPDRGVLFAAGLTESQVYEGVIAAALGNALATIHYGLGVLPDFQPIRTFCAKELYLSSSESRHTKHIPPLEDPDIDVISRVKAGESEAFEDLVRRHTRRIFCTLYGLLGNREEARDATQDTFMKAFEYIEKFEGRSKFSTWLTSIAVNTGTEFLRKRRPMESLDEHEEEGFRPRQIQSWIDNPEMAFGKAQLNELVRDGVLRLPEKYRMALTLRDLQQLSTEDTASALGLSIPATKARVLRGRLMLRESLTPHFTKPRRDNHV